MNMTLEGSNSAETFSPSSGDTGLHLLSLWDVWVGWCVDFLEVFNMIVFWGFRYLVYACRALLRVCDFVIRVIVVLFFDDLLCGFQQFNDTCWRRLSPAKLSGTSYDMLCSIVTSCFSLTKAFSFLESRRYSLRAAWSPGKRYAFCLDSCVLLGN